MLRKDEEHEWKRSLAYVSRMHICARMHVCMRMHIDLIHFSYFLSHFMRKKTINKLYISQPFFLQKYPTNYCSNIFGIHVDEFVQENEVQ